MSRAIGCTAVCSRELSRRLDPLEAFESLRGDPYPWLLDSATRGATGDSRRDRYSFAGADPYWVLRAYSRRVELEGRREVRPGVALGREVVVGDPFEVLRSLLPHRPSLQQEPVDPCSSSLPFLGGAVGYLGYELAEFVEPVTSSARNDLGLPDLCLLFVDRLLAFDHLEQRTFAVGLGFATSAAAAAKRAELAADAMLAGTQSEARPRVPHARRDLTEPAALLAREPGNEVLSQRRRLLATSPPDSARGDFSAESYAQAVETIREEIAAGNVYQATLTQRLELVPEGSDGSPSEAWSRYQLLRELSPAPFAAYIELPEVTILSSSPERFLALDAEGCVESRPIKGTRPRGGTRAEDASLATELEHSEKDRAENLMIVDLVRNDLGRVCETGSVAVPELMAVEAYASVIQLVSPVTGRLREEHDAVDLLRASFPPGSMTGAPKIAAMRLIDRLEPVRRGIYSGAIGYFDVRGGADLSVVIRTLLLAKGRAYLHAGGAIVADSDPAAEYRESLDKARALLAALGVPRG
jgi:para-aminobenzoate synthetase component 1